MISARLLFWSRIECTKVGCSNTALLIQVYFHFLFKWCHIFDLGVLQGGVLSHQTYVPGLVCSFCLESRWRSDPWILGVSLGSLSPAARG